MSGTGSASGTAPGSASDADGARVTVRLLFVEDGAFHHEEIQVAAEAVERHERLIDLLQEEPEVLRRTYVDLERLCSAHLVEDQGHGRGKGQD